MKSWFALYTQPSKELLAQRHLQEQGFDVYLPRFKKIRRHARKTETILAPLFPRYLFVGIDLEHDRWRSINGTRGVSYLLTNGDQPISIPLSIIEKLKKQEDSEGALPITSLITFLKGDSVRIIEGAFENQIALFEKLDDKQRVQLLLNLLGQTVKVTLPSHEIEAA